MTVKTYKHTIKLHGNISQVKRSTGIFTKLIYEFKYRICVT